MTKRTQYGHSLIDLSRAVSRVHRVYKADRHLNAYIESLEGTDEDAWLSTGLCDDWSMMDLLNNYLVWAVGKNWSTILSVQP